jgi:hypothetical protein
MDVWDGLKNLLMEQSKTQAAGSGRDLWIMLAQRILEQRHVTSGALHGKVLLWACPFVGLVVCLSKPIIKRNFLEYLYQ